MSQNRLLIIGLDGAAFDYIDPLIEQGKLPNIAHLIRSGARSNLRSVLHPYTAQAWTTMCTGQNAGRHGIFDFWERDFSHYAFKIPIPQRRAAPAIWEYVNAQGFPSVIINVPMTYPPDHIKGIFISGREVPGYQSPYTYPPEVKMHIQSVSGGSYVIVPNDWMWMKRGQPEHALDAILEEIDIRFKVATDLLKTTDWLFSMFVVAATDSVNHFFAKFCDPSNHDYHPNAAQRLRNAISQVYEDIDRRIGELLACLPSDINILIVSDHGSGSESNVMVHLNSWLAQHHLLSFKAEVSRPSAQLRAWMISNLRTAAEFVPYQSLTWLRSKFGGKMRSRLSQESLFNGVDWLETKAFSEERRGNIWLNVKDRDPLGIVNSGREYDEIVQYIQQELPKLTHPDTGETVIRKVWRRQELFNGEFTTSFPDLIVEATIPDVFRHSAISGVPQPIELASKGMMRGLPTSGGHRHEGILIAAGPQIRPGVSIPRSDLIDVTLNALCLLGLPVPIGIEGKLWNNALIDAVTLNQIRTNSEVVSQAIVESQRDLTVSTGTESDAAIIEERLSALGYLD